MLGCFKIPDCFWWCTVEGNTGQTGVLQKFIDLYQKKKATETAENLARNSKINTKLTNAEIDTKLTNAEIAAEEALQIAEEVLESAEILSVDAIKVKAKLNDALKELEELEPEIRGEILNSLFQPIEEAKDTVVKKIKKIEEKINDVVFLESQN